MGFGTCRRFQMQMYTIPAGDKNGYTNAHHTKDKNFLRKLKPDVGRDHFRNCN
eukprot:m.271182 g.271182  ORF g.271182 m.271182 type:complete len:53 (-) comp93739_c0_seq1:314-472(-)